ncbi:hypothetical protein [Stigmatella aurantiaca]|uniref:Lipoprotein n=1 Tax=Stigmatella aurantiaca (strain DW4/3-1) TaxID=378806 RepID=Q08W70_STIAD|nr:hypothetical protein [Stigmatella aurantiaca]ADO71768.1 uncharacterized protein STAUR_3980 [Stigmatella aurantiaca DW4/3-1]EAU64736.1 hypothetical protein STIAU_2619 [Stigmatella aurantiaca DW4/3-1]
MRVKGFIGSVLLVAGLLTGCGGSEVVAQDVSGQPPEEAVSAQALPPCQQACVNGYQTCRKYNLAPIEECLAERDACFELCLSEQ